MSEIVPIPAAELMPTPESVLGQMGVPKHAIGENRAYELTKEAIEVLLECVEPAGLLSEISVEEMAAIYRGEGENAGDTPLEHIFTKADALAGYALTLGDKISQRIEEIWKSDDVALGGVLDSAASVAADNGAELCEVYFQEKLSKRQGVKGDRCVLAYSPGYCGWHVSGQKRLFQRIQPEKIGITLNKNCLMIPVKSVSGVLVAGERAINYFKPKWEFCDTCATHSCLKRMKSLRDAVKSDNLGVQP